MIRLENVSGSVKLLITLITLLMISPEHVWLLAPWCCIRPMEIGSLFNVLRTARENNSEIKLLKNVYTTVQILLSNISLIIELLIVSKYVRMIHMHNRSIIHVFFNVLTIHMDIWKNVFLNVLKGQRFTTTIQLGFVWQPAQNFQIIIQIHRVKNAWKIVQMVNLPIILPVHVWQP